MYENEEDDQYDVGGLGAAPLGSSPAALAAWQQAQALVAPGNQRNLDLLNAARERIRQQRVGPSQSEQLFAIAAALGQPTRTGTFGETMGNLSGAILKQQAAKRTAQEEKQALLEKYGMDIEDRRLRMLTSAANQAGQTYSRTAAADAAQARAAAAANKPQRRRTAISPVDGRIYDLDTGAVVEPPAQDVPADAVAYLKANPKTAAAFDGKYGAGKAAQYLGGQ